MLCLGPLLLAFNLLGASAQPAVDLGTANDFAILTKTGITTTGTTSVTGDMGTSPISSAAITGFDLILGSSTSTSALVTGNIYAADYTDPTPSKMITAISDMQSAYTDVAGRPNTLDANLNLGAGSIEGKTLAPGLYKWGTSVGFTNSLTFEGDATDVWILQIAENLIIGSGAIVTLSGGALAENIFWQVAGNTELGTTAHMEGIILCATGIVFKTGSSLNGAALAQTAVTLDQATIVKKG